MTGGLGFIGTALCVELARTGCTVVAADRTRSSNRLPSEVADRIAIVEIDVHSDTAKLDALIAAERIEGIVHLAVHRRRDDPIGTMAGNAAMLTALLRIADRNDVAALVHASSLAVYFGARETPYTEDLPLAISSSNPIEAIKKLDELMLAEAAGRTSEMVIASARLGNVYGPGYRSFANPPSQYCHAAAGRLDPSTIGSWNDSPFAQALDYVHVFDAARALAMLVTSPELQYGCYNVGSQSAASPGDIARLVEQMSGHRFAGADGPTAVPDRHLDTTRLRKELDWSPRYDLRSGLEQYLDWLRTHEH